MKKKTSPLVTAVGAAAILASCAGAILYIIAARDSYDLSINHFKNVPAVTALVCCFIAAAVLSAAAGVLSRKKASVAGGAYNAAVIAVYVVTGALILAYGALGIIDLLRSASPAEVTRDYVTSVASPILAVFASVYFILIPGREKTEGARSIFGVAAILWAIVVTLDVYFRKGEPINSAAKAILLVVAICDLLFITEDVRFPLGTQKAASYRAVALLAVCAGLTFALPDCVFAAARLAGGDAFASAPQVDLIPSLISAALGASAFVRIVTLPSCLVDYEPPKHEKPAAKAAEQTDEEPGSAE